MSIRENDYTKYKCLGCGKQMLILIQKNHFDTRFGIKGNYNITQCRSCDLIQLSPHPTGDEFKALYEMYYNFRGSRRSLYTKIREKFLDSILYRIWIIIDGDHGFHSFRGTGRLLDVGCNEGRGLRIYQKNGFTADGLELNEHAALEAKKKGLRVITRPLDTFSPEKLFDVVVLSNVLEHSLNPKKTLLHVSRILKPNGQIWISCPNVNSWQRKIFGRFWINWHVPFHIVHFSRRTLATMLRETGFKNQKIWMKSPALWLAQSIISSIFAIYGRPTKQLRNVFLVATLMICIRILFFPILWLGNRLGRGDCLVVIAQKEN